MQDKVATTEYRVKDPVEFSRNMIKVAVQSQRLVTDRDRARTTARNPEFSNLARLRAQRTCVITRRCRSPAHISFAPVIERLVRHTVNREARIRHQRRKSETARHWIEQQLRSERQQDAVQAYVTALRERLGVSINEALFRRTTGVSADGR